MNYCKRRLSIRIKIYAYICSFERHIFNRLLTDIWNPEHQQDTKHEHKFKKRNSVKSKAVNEWKNCKTTYSGLGTDIFPNQKWTKTGIKASKIMKVQAENYTTYDYKVHLESFHTLSIVADIRTLPRKLKTDL